MLAVGLLLYIYRKVVEDRTGVPWREETPEMPPEEAPAAAPVPAQRLVRAELPPRELRYGPAIAPAVDRPDE